MSNSAQNSLPVQVAHPIHCKSETLICHYFSGINASDEHMVIRFDCIIAQNTSQVGLYAKMLHTPLVRSLSLRANHKVKEHLGIANWCQINFAQAGGIIVSLC